MGCTAYSVVVGTCSKKVGPGDTGPPRFNAGSATADSSCTGCVSGTTYGAADGSANCEAVTVCGKQAGGSAGDRLTGATAIAGPGTCAGCTSGSWGSAAGTAAGDCTAYSVVVGTCSKKVGPGDTGAARFNAGSATADS